MTFAALRTACLQGLSQRYGRAKIIHISPNPLMNFVLLQGITCTGPPLAGPPLVGFWAPTAFEITESDLHRVFLARLCCVYRLSKPLDALIPSETLTALFHAVDALGVPPFKGFPS
jgi:hypothetical protein